MKNTKIGTYVCSRLDSSVYPFWVQKV